MVADLGLDDAVELTGAVDPTRIPDLLARMDVAVAPYPRLDDFYFSPLKLYEYLAAGVPVVAGDAGNLPELLAGPDGPLGITYPAGSVDDLAATIALLRAGPELRADLARRGRADARRLPRLEPGPRARARPAGGAPWRRSGLRTCESGGGPVDVTDETPFLVDPCLPGAGLLLARGSLEGWLSERLGRPAQVTLRRLRYKPGTSLVLGFDLATDAPGAPRSCLAWAYADGSQAKLGKTLERLPPSTFLAYDARLTVLATTAGGDRYLPALARLERPGGLARTVQRVLPGLDAPEDVRVRTLRHNPGRRWVGCLESGGDGSGTPVAPSSAPTPTRSRWAAPGAPMRSSRAGAPRRNVRWVGSARPR